MFDGHITNKNSETRSRLSKNSSSRIMNRNAQAKSEDKDMPYETKSQTHGGDSSRLNSQRSASNIRSFDNASRKSRVNDARSLYSRVSYKKDRTEDLRYQIFQKLMEMPND